MKKLKIAALLALPIALGLCLNSTMSWRPRTLAAYREPVLSVAWAPDGKQLASAGGDGKVSVWDVGSMRLERVLEAKPGKASGVAFSPDGKWLAASLNGSPNDDWGAVRLWDARSGKLGRSWRNYTGMNSVAFSSDGKLLAASTVSSAVVWNLQSGSARGDGTANTFSIRGIVISPDGWDVVGIGEERPMWWTRRQVVKGSKALSIQKPPRSRCAAFSPDGKTLALGSRGQVALFDVASHKQRGLLPALSSRVDAVAFSPDGAILACGLADSRIEMWDVPSRKRVRVLEGHRAAITSLAFAPDGSTLASASDDGTLRLWRVR